MAIYIQSESHLYHMLVHRQKIGLSLASPFMVLVTQRVTGSLVFMDTKKVARIIIRQKYLSYRYYGRERESSGEVSCSTKKREKDTINQQSVNNFSLSFSYLANNCDSTVAAIKT